MFRVRVTSIAGPDSGRSFTTLPPSSIGSSSRADVQIADPGMQPIEIVLGSEEITRPTHLRTPSDVAGCETLQLGHSLLLVENSIGELATDARWNQGVVVRRRRTVREPPPERTQPPPRPSPPSPSAWVFPVVTLLSSILMSVVVHSWTFLMFGCAGAVTGGSHLALEFVKFRRSLREFRADLKGWRERDAATLAARERYELMCERDRWPIDFDHMVSSDRLWERRLDDADALEVVLGVCVSDQNRSPTSTIGCRTVLVNLVDEVLAVQSPRDTAVAISRSILAQLMVNLGPADLALLVDDCIGVDLPPAFRARPRDERPIVIVSEGVHELAIRTSWLRELLDNGTRCSAIVLCEPGDVLPSRVDSVLTAAGGWCGTLRTAHSETQIHIAGISGETFMATAAHLRPLVDPECVVRHDSEIPHRVVMSDEAHLPPTLSALSCQVGASGDGFVELDFVRDGPHALIAGTTGSGKSELLRTIVSSLCARHDADVLNLVLIDHKGGATFSEFRDFPQVVDVIADLDGELNDRVLRGLELELIRREHTLSELGRRDVAECVPSAHSVCRLVIVVDEFAAMAQHHPDHLKSLVNIGARGRSLGMHLILATQRPAGVVSEDIRANTNIRIALRLHDATDSLDVIGTRDANEIDTRRPGRALIRIGGDPPIEVQTALPNVPEPSALKRRAALRGIEAPMKPWADDLPFELDDQPIDLGLMQLPNERLARAVNWSPEDGALELFGPVGSGTTTALISILTMNSNVPSYVVDARGDERLQQLEELAHVAPTIAGWDDERVQRLLNMVNAEVESRRKLHCRTHLMLIVIDGLDELRRQLSPDARDQLERVLNEGEGVGIIAVTVNGERRSRAATRWDFTGRPLRSHSPGEHRTSGWVMITRNGRSVPARVRPVTPVRHEPTALPPPAVGVLPVVVAPTVLCGRLTERTVELEIGIDFDSLSPAVITIRRHEHVLVLGPSGSGRTNALRAVATAWQRATHGQVTNVGDLSLGCVPRVDGHHLVVIDDAHLVGDDSEFSMRLTNHDEDLTVAAAADVDALRSTYGHWTQILRRSRCGILLTESNGDGIDLFGITRPPRSELPPRPGLAWIVNRGALRVAQIAAMLVE